MNVIDYKLIGRAIAWYESLGFKYIEVPWIVSDEAVGVTLPDGRLAFGCADGALVGSAEQSFIQMMLDGKLDSGSYVAASPCFRDDKEDEWHQRTFFKVELISINRLADTLAAHALRLFEIEGATGARLKMTDEGADIELGGIELGSYGRRSFAGGDLRPGLRWSWAYGTGIAEPRFSMAMRQLGLQRKL